MGLRSKDQEEQGSSFSVHLCFLPSNFILMGKMYLIYGQDKSDLPIRVVSR